MNLSDLCVANATLVIHHIFGLAILVKDGSQSARNYLREQIYG